jgi:hypothetical protein
VSASEIKRISELERKVEDLSKLAQIIPVMVEQLGVLRGAVWAMMSQAERDEPSRDPAANPWITHKLTYARAMNPHIRALNEALGIKVEAPKQDAAPSIIIATEAKGSREPTPSERTPRS